jgi:hypothetical protein
MYQSTSNGVITSEMTNFCKSVVWSGDVEQYARKLEVTMCYSIWDKNQPKVQIGPGTIVWMVENGEEIFRGVVFDRSISSAAQELKFTAYDFLIYFTKSKGYYNFSGITPEAITKMICEAEGIETGEIAETGILVTFLAKSKALIDIILQAYTYVYKKNGTNFMPFMSGTKFGIRTMGTLADNFVLSPDLNINNTEFNDTMNNMINKVNIYNTDGSSSMIENTPVRKAFGILQDIVEAEDGKDSIKAANNLFHNIDNTVSIPAIGNTSCKAGYAVKVAIPYIELLSDLTMYILTDSHTFDPSTGRHTMELNLSLENKMKLVEEG